MLVGVSVSVAGGLKPQGFIGSSLDMKPSSKRTLIKSVETIIETSLVHTRLSSLG